MINVRADFLTALDGHDLDALEADKSTIIGVDDSLRIAYLNPAWSRFAQENAGQPGIARHWGLGASIMPALGVALQPFYSRLFSQAFARSHVPTPSPQPLTHSYECSSAEVYRLFALIIYPLRLNRGLLLIHSLAVEHPHAAQASEPHAAHLPTYAGKDGIITQCSHCRRVRVLGDPMTWHWIPQWVSAVPHKASHGLCPICLDYYYPPDG